MAIIKVATALSLLHVFTVLAVDLGAPIVGCSEVDCPTITNTTSADCRVGDRTSSVIGLANLDTLVADGDFTWTQGIQVYDNVDPNVDNDRTYEKNFYLGTPQGFDMVRNATAAGYGGCALFFTKVTNLVKFAGDNVVTSVGTCNRALSSDCVDALLDQATKIAGSSLSTSDSCQRLLSDFNDNLSSQCPRFATGDKWQGLQVQDLTGSNAPKPLTEAQNSTSNCHPTLPKSNSLTRVTAFNISGTTVAQSIVDNIYSITPILTVFFPLNGSVSAELKQPEARLTCLKGVGETDAAIATSSSVDDNKDSAGQMSSPKLVILVLAMMVSVGILA